MNGNGKGLMAVIGLACTIIGLLLGGAGMSVLVRDDVIELKTRINVNIEEIRRFRDWAERHESLPAHRDHMHAHPPVTKKDDE